MEVSPGARAVQRLVLQRVARIWKGVIELEQGGAGRSGDRLSACGSIEIYTETRGLGDSLPSMI